MDELKDQVDLVKRGHQSLEEKIVFMSDPITGKNSSSAAEKQVVQALRTAPGRQTLSSAAKKHLDLEFREAHNGSIIIRFCPKLGKSLQKLKQSCATGKIKDVLASIFMQSGVEYTLGEGDFRWKFSIYKTCILFYHSAQETAFPVLRMVNEEDVIKDYWKLLVEEIDPWTFLLDLQMKGLLGEEDGNKMLKLDSRKDCVKFLLERILASEEPDLGYEILLDHCREHNEYVYQKIQATEGQLDFYGYVDKRCQSEQEMLFTATVILSIHRKEINPKQYGSNMKLEISHLTIQEPICYFDIEAEAPEEESDAADLQKEVVMVLEQVL